MARTVILTKAATSRFENAVRDWWAISGNTGKPGVDRIAAVLNCDRRTVMRLRNRQPNDRNLLFALFAAQAKKPLSKEHLALWELVENDFEDSHLSAWASSLLTEGEQLYQGANFLLAEKRCQEAMGLFRQAGNRRGEAGVYHLRGRLEVAQGRFDCALAHIECALELNRALDDVMLSADLYELRGTIFMRQGNWQQSRESFLKSLAIWENLKHLHSIADLEISLAGMETRAKCAPQARIHLENARKTIEAIKDAPLRASLMLQEARLFLLEGKPEAATDCANDALAYWNFARHPRWKAFSHLILAEIAAKQCHIAAASQHAALSLKLYEQVGDLYGTQQARQIMTAKPTSHAQGI